MGALNFGRVLLRREVIAVFVLLVVGIAAGFYIGHALAGEKRGAPTDYAILVARLFENDGNVTLAVERLKEAGVESPAQAVATMAAQHSTSTPESARDAESLHKLATALGGTTPAQSSGGIPTTYLLAALIAVATLGLAALLAVRILGLRLPTLRQPAALRSVIDAASARRRSFSGESVQVPEPPDETAAPGGVGEPVRQTVLPGGIGRNGHIASTAPATYPNGTSVRTRPMTSSDPTSPTGNGQVGPQTLKPKPSRPTQLRAVPPIRGYSFRSSYRLGDEPYDEIHPISDDGGHTLVGACGVSASRYLADSGQKRYWGFTAWLHDYATDGQFRAVGLVSRWAFDHFSDEIDEWRSLGDIDEIRQVDYDEAIELRTVNLAATLSIEDIDYLHGAPPDAFVNRLAALFDVKYNSVSPVRHSPGDDIAAEG